MKSNGTVSNALSPDLFTTAGIYITIVTIGSILFNGTAIYVIGRKFRIRNHQMKILLSMFIGDALAPALSSPLAVHANFKRRWSLGSKACSYFAFVATTGGLSNINHLLLLSGERFFAMVHPYKYDRIVSPRKVNIALLVSWMLSATTSALPLFGWSSYSMEGIGTACCFDLSPTAWQGRSFNLFLIFGYFALSLLLVVYFNISFLRITFSLAKCPCKKTRDSDRTSSHHTQFCQLNMDRKLAKQMSLLVSLLIFFFLVSWLPYAVVAVLGVFDKLPQDDRVTISIPSFFAKIYSLCDPVIYFFLDKRFRKAARSLICWSNAVGNRNNLETCAPTYATGRN